MARWTLRRALKELGLPESFSVRTSDSYEHAMANWKRLTVAARLINDDARAAVLSLCKNLIKKHHQKHQNRICPSCGNGKSESALHCRVCSVKIQFYSHDLNDKALPMHEIESALTSIPPVEKRHGELVEALKKLSKGQIGDSIVTNRSSSSALFMAKTLGGQVICRTVNSEEKELKKRKYRVWRSDGLSMEQVNEIIRKRRAGEKVPPPKEWIPMTAEERKKLNDRNHPKHDKPGRPPAPSAK